MPKRDDKYMADRRDEILDAAIACLIRTGLPGLSTTAICKEGGISMGALYTHFRTKDDIVGAIAERSASRRRRKLEVSTADELQRRLAAMVRETGTEEARQATRVDFELLGAARHDERIARSFDPFRDNRDLVEAIQSLKRSGEAPADLDPEVAATAIEALLAGFSVLSLMGRKYAPTHGAAMKLLLGCILS